MDVYYGVENNELYLIEPQFIHNPVPYGPLYAIDCSCAFSTVPVADVMNEKESVKIVYIGEL